MSEQQLTQLSTVLLEQILQEIRNVRQTLPHSHSHAHSHCHSSSESSSVATTTTTGVVGSSTMLRTGAPNDRTGAPNDRPPSADRPSLSRSDSGRIRVITAAATPDTAESHSATEEDACLDACPDSDGECDEAVNVTVAGGEGGGEVSDVMWEALAVLVANTRLRLDLNQKYEHIYSMTQKKLETFRQHT